jgi:hypothetical protein
VTAAAGDADAKARVLETLRGARTIVVAQVLTARATRRRPSQSSIPCGPGCFAIGEGYFRLKARDTTTITGSSSWYDGPMTQRTNEVDDRGVEPGDAMSRAQRGLRERCGPRLAPTPPRIPRERDTNLSSSWMVDGPGIEPASPRRTMALLARGKGPGSGQCPEDGR